MSDQEQDQQISSFMLEELAGEIIKNALKEAGMRTGLSHMQTFAVALGIIQSGVEFVMGEKEGRRLLLEIIRDQPTHNTDPPLPSSDAVPDSLPPGM